MAEVPGVQRDVPQVVKRPPDDHVVAQPPARSQGLLEPARPTNRIAFAPIDLAQCDERARYPPRVIELGPPADRQPLLDERARTGVLAINASEPAKGRERAAEARGVAELPEQRQALGERGACGVVFAAPKRRIARIPQQHPRSPSVTELFEERTRLADCAPRGVPTGRTSRREDQRQGQLALETERAKQPGGLLGERDSNLVITLHVRKHRGS